MKLDNEYLIKIIGGAITTTWINSLVKLFTTAVDFGKMIGTTIRRLVSKKKVC